MLVPTIAGIEHDSKSMKSGGLPGHRGRFRGAGKQHMRLRRTFRIALAVSSLLAAAACTPQTSAPKLGNTVAASVAIAPTESTPQPRTATYKCADGSMMTIENLGTSVRVLGPDGTSSELPASPANQTSRYGEAHDAIVIDGRDALVMKGGASPVACTR
ncbi:hypothetical protein X759_33765 [Mesorhizobium sp. LSHC420B00]|nr:hypothetical protein X759_33765 [Mesorhizobium sp. LSHC420B00]